MVITRLQGGLGNQMFQYALGRKLSLKLGAELLLDTSIYGSTTIASDGRLYRLAYFNINGNTATEAQIRSIGYPYGIFVYKLKKTFDRVILKRNHTKFEPAVLSYTGNIYLEGFWQSEKYFKDIRQTLLKDLTLKEPLSAAATEIRQNILKEKKSISLHVRRGDYVENQRNIQVYGDHCGPKYYARALSMVITNPSDTHVFIFSDDIKWVKKNIDIPYQKTYISTDAAPDYEQMMLMSYCNDHIIANSTYSWWGAWLDTKENSTVVAPSVWTPGVDLPIDDIIPSHWKRVDSQ